MQQFSHSVSTITVVPLAMALRNPLYLSLVGASGLLIRFQSSELERDCCLHAPTDVAYDSMTAKHHFGCWFLLMNRGQSLTLHRDLKLVLLFCPRNETPGGCFVFGCLL